MKIRKFFTVTDLVYEDVKRSMIASYGRKNLTPVQFMVELRERLGLQKLSFLREEKFDHRKWYPAMKGRE